ncbi:hypothetical protein J1N51_12955 [Psychrosphaera ytuae]|uniref:Uncharacterized protein n=1 Tax=Psychrosphaera ytuae TaxID=2820710 RepID=A0A975HHW7_9GAMM|nr:hypothetical protein [Psychrosphaera ytuae]QTH63616.1 hypothetical protein J1N51_12955 [Psychrosphaera ytuae]
MNKFLVVLFLLTISTNVFSARPPGGVNQQVNIYSRADMCIDCSEAKAEAFVLSLVPSYAVTDSKHFIYVVDPIRDTKIRYEIEAVRNSKGIIDVEPMTSHEQRLFEPLMSYARSVVDLKQKIAQTNADSIANSELCDSSLDTYSNKSCGKAIMDDLKNEARIRNLFNFNRQNYSVTIGADSKVINGSITLSGQGNDGILRVAYMWSDGSISVYKVKDGEIIELDTELSKSATGETLKRIIADLDAEKFAQRGIRGHELADHVDLWSGHAGMFCDLLPSYKFVQMEVLECRSKVTPSGLKIECRKVGTTNSPTVAFSCR